MWELVNPAAYPSPPPAPMQTAQQAAKHLEQMYARIMLAVKASAAEKLLELGPSADLALYNQVSYRMGGHHHEDAAQWMPALRFRRLWGAVVDAMHITVEDCDGMFGKVRIRVPIETVQLSNFIVGMLERLGVTSNRRDGELAVVVIAYILK